MCDVCVSFDPIGWIVWGGIRYDLMDGWVCVLTLPISLRINQHDPNTQHPPIRIRTPIHPYTHRARQLATERRRKTLLVEYKALKKDNVFRDRRFGEDDPSLSLEEKMLLRFQKERQRRARASGGGGKAGRFNLEEGDDEEYEEDEEYGGLRLTHRGKALGEDDYRDQDALGSSDEDDDAGGGLGRQIVKVRVRGRDAMCGSLWGRKW